MTDLWTVSSTDDNLLLTMTSQEEEEMKECLTARLSNEVVPGPFEAVLNGYMSMCLDENETEIRDGILESPEHHIMDLCLGPLARRVARLRSGCHGTRQAPAIN